MIVIKLTNLNKSGTTKNSWNAELSSLVEKLITKKKNKIVSIVIVFCFSIITN